MPDGVPTVVQYLRNKKWQGNGLCVVQPTHAQPDITTVFELFAYLQRYLYVAKQIAVSVMNQFVV